MHATYRVYATFKKRAGPVYANRGVMLIEGMLIEGFDCTYTVTRSVTRALLQRQSPNRNTASDRVG